MSYLDLVRDATPGVVILLEASTDDYQGDTDLLLAAPDGRFGYLGFGWGSCSGCDAYEAAESEAELADLRDELARTTHWEPSAYDLASWVCHRDWALQLHGDEKTRAFVWRALEILAEYADRPVPPLPSAEK